jgi:predicted RecA/RadA family phage recombinase
MAVGETVFDNDGKSVTVPATATVAAGDVVYISGWLGIAEDDVDSGEDVAVTVDMRAYQFEVPAGLSVSAGNTVWIDVTDLTGHKPDSSAYYVASGSNRIRLFRAIEDKDANNVVTGVLIGGLNLS